MKYRKKPVVVEATQLTEVTFIETLEGTMKGDIGDWLIIGVNGEKYPCKNDIFQKTYELAETTLHGVIHGSFEKENGID